MIKSKQVLSFINKQLLKDKKEYRGHIPTKYNKGSEWNDFNWLVDEINAFLNKNLLTSYILQEFTDKYTFNELQDIIKSNFKREYEYCINKLN